MLRVEISLFGASDALTARQIAPRRAVLPFFPRDGPAALENTRGMTIPLMSPALTGMAAKRLRAGLFAPLRRLGNHRAGTHSRKGLGRGVFL